jgi:hypothetical protein
MEVGAGSGHFSDYNTAHIAHGSEVSNIQAGSCALTTTDTNACITLYHLELKVADAILMDHIIVSDKAQFHLCGEVNTHNRQYRSAANPCVLHGKLLHSEKSILFSLMYMYPAKKEKYVHTVYVHSIAFMW